MPFQCDFCSASFLDLFHFFHLSLSLFFSLSHPSPPIDNCCAAFTFYHRPYTPIITHTLYFLPGLHTHGKNLSIRNDRVTVSSSFFRMFRLALDSSPSLSLSPSASSNIFTTILRNQWTCAFFRQINFRLLFSSFNLHVCDVSVLCSFVIFIVKLTTTVVLHIHRTYTDHPTTFLYIYRNATLFSRIVFFFYSFLHRCTSHYFSRFHVLPLSFSLWLLLQLLSFIVKMHIELRLLNFLHDSHQRKTHFSPVHI